MLRGLVADEGLEWGYVGDGAMLVKRLWRNREVAAIRSGFVIGYCSSDPPAKFMDAQEPFVVAL